MICVLQGGNLREEYDLIENEIRECRLEKRSIPSFVVFTSKHANFVKMLKKLSTPFTQKSKNSLSKTQSSCSRWKIPSNFSHTNLYDTTPCIYACLIVDTNLS